MDTKRTTFSNHRRSAWVMTCALAAITSTAAWAGSQNSDKPCSTHTIRGAYGIQMQGTRPVPPPTGGTEAVVGLVLRTFDGDGNFTQIDNIKGSVTGLRPDGFGVGTYEVNPDCTGSTQFQPDANNPALVIRERLIIVKSGGEIRGMGESPSGLMVTSVASRIVKK